MEIIFPSRSVVIEVLQKRVFSNKLNMHTAFMNKVEKMRRRGEDGPGGSE